MKIIIVAVLVAVAGDCFAAGLFGSRSRRRNNDETPRPPQYVPYEPRRITPPENPVHVEGYQNSQGTYVQPYRRTRPDNTRWNNYGTEGNTNPYTGRQGTRRPQGGGLFGGDDD